MSELVVIISEYYLYVLTGVISLIVIIYFVKQNSEEFPYPAECFNCNNPSCKGCTCLPPHKRLTHQKRSRPVVSQPVPCLQRVEVNVQEQGGQRSSEKQNY